LEAHELIFRTDAGSNIIKWAYNQGELVGDGGCVFQLIRYYGLRYLTDFGCKAKSGVGDSELFLELHQRAAQKSLKHGTRYE
jgi:hypothetical protein